MVKQKVGTILLLIIATMCAIHAQSKQNPAQNASKCSEFEKGEGIEDFLSLVREIERNIIEQKLKIGDQKIFKTQTSTHYLECLNIITGKDPYYNEDGEISYYKLESNGKTYLLKRSQKFFGYMCDVGVFDKKIEHKGIAKIYNACIIFAKRTEEFEENEYEMFYENSHSKDDSCNGNHQLTQLTEKEELAEKRKLAKREHVARTYASNHRDESEDVYIWYATKYGTNIYYALIEYLPLRFVEVLKDEWNNAGVDVIEDEYASDRSIDVILKMGLDIAQAIKHLNDKGLLHQDVCLGNIRGCRNEEGDWEFKLFSHNYIAEMLPFGMTPTRFSMRAYLAPEASFGDHTRRHMDVFCLGRVLFFCQKKYKEMCENKSGEVSVFQDPRKLKILEKVVSKIYYKSISVRPYICDVIDILQIALEDLKKMEKE